MFMSDNWTIRAGGAQDWRALRMLLPQAFFHGSGAQSLVATTEDGRLIIGAAAMSPRLRSHPLPGVSVAAHVVPPYRRRGLGRQLVNACRSLAMQRNASGLYAWQPLAEASEDASAYRRLGFDRTVAVQEGRADVEMGYKHLKPLYDQVMERQWIPAGARLVPYDQADAIEIAKLHVMHLGGQMQEILSRLRGQSPVRYHPRLSPVVLVDGHVMGFTLAQVLAGGMVLVDSTVVDPQLRGGWANLWLKFAGVSECRDMAIHTVVYYTYDNHSDTRKLSRQVGAVSRQLVEPYQVLQHGDAPPPDAPRDHIHVPA
jgi:GNAT superfamily N-acetyltransferase